MAPLLEAGLILGMTQIDGGRQAEMEEYTVAYKEMECNSLQCLVSIPPSQRPEEGWPILIFLHGRGEAAPLDLRVAMTRHGPLRSSSGSAATERFVVIAPQLPQPGGDVWNQFAGQVQAIARKAADKYQGNPSQVYLTGFSYGGNGVLDIGAGHPGVWAALWPVEATRRPVSGTDLPVWVSAGEYARRHISSYRRMWDVQAPPHPTSVYEDRNLDHVPTAIEAYGDVVIYDWLLTHPHSLT